MYDLVIFLVRLFRNISDETPEAFPYIPQMYLETSIEAFHSLRRADPPYDLLQGTFGRGSRTKQSLSCLPLLSLILCVACYFYPQSRTGRGCKRCSHSSSRISPMHGSSTPVRLASCGSCSISKTHVPCHVIPSPYRHKGFAAAVHFRAPAATQLCTALGGKPHCAGAAAADDDRGI